MDNVNEIYVYENWKSDTPSLIGTLYVDGGRGKQIVSFEYDDEWLNDFDEIINNCKTPILDLGCGTGNDSLYSFASSAIFLIF